MTSFRNTEFCEISSCGACLRPCWTRYGTENMYLLYAPPRAGNVLSFLPTPPACKYCCVYVINYQHYVNCLSRFTHYRTSSLLFSRLTELVSHLFCGIFAQPKCWLAICYYFTGNKFSSMRMQMNCNGMRQCNPDCLPLVLSQLSCPSFPVPTVLPQHSCPQLFSLCPVFLVMFYVKSCLSVLRGLF